jgi:L-lactate dehydrogenase complex protein LldG
MTMNALSARDEILSKVRCALGRQTGTPAPLPPASARLPAREAGEPEDEMNQLFAEIGKLGGTARRLPSSRTIPAALRELVEAEAVRKAMVWETPELRGLGIADSLRGLGVEVVPPQADPKQLAECDLGVTGVDAALPETGTLLLRSSPSQPRLVSLLPRVHLALLSGAALRPDLSQAFAEVKTEGYVVCITGPSRTADIELTVTVGVHGPKSLYVWAVDMKPASGGTER